MNYVDNSQHTHQFYICQVNPIYQDLLLKLVVDSEETDVSFSSLDELLEISDLAVKKTNILRNAIFLFMLVNVGVSCALGFSNRPFLPASSNHPIAAIATNHHTPEFMVSNAVKNTKSLFLDQIENFIIQENRFPSTYEIKLIVQDQLENFFSTKYLNLNGNILDSASKILQRKVIGEIENSGNQPLFGTICLGPARIQSASNVAKTTPQHAASAQSSLYFKAPAQKGFVAGSVSSKTASSALEKLALPKGNNEFWYETRIAGTTYTDEHQSEESVIYSLEFPQKDGLIATRIGESCLRVGGRKSEHIQGLKCRQKQAKHMLPHFDQLQLDFPEEKLRDGFVLPRFQILEKGSDLDNDVYRLEREKYYKDMVRLDPERVLINPEKY